MIPTLKVSRTSLAIDETGDRVEGFGRLTIADVRDRVHPLVSARTRLPYEAVELGGHQAHQVGCVSVACYYDILSIAEMGRQSKLS